MSCDMWPKMYISATRKLGHTISEKRKRVGRTVAMAQILKGKRHLESNTLFALSCEKRTGVFVSFQNILAFKICPYFNSIRLEFLCEKFNRCPHEKKKLKSDHCLIWSIYCNCTSINEYNIQTNTSKHT